MPETKVIAWTAGISLGVVALYDMDFLGIRTMARKTLGPILLPAPAK